MIEKHAVPGAPAEAFVTPPHVTSRQTGRPAPARKSSSGTAAGRARDWIVGEPPLSDFFEDPLVLAVLRRDGLSLEDLARAIAAGRQRLADTLPSQAA
jgi:hypothetical protein